MKLLLVGGFLGSGKTTAIRNAAVYLQQQGQRVGIITNDQGAQQVDTRFIAEAGLPVEEVANGCFCCRYQDLEHSINALKQNNNATIIFAEPVGSCADLAATVVNPLLSYNPGEYEIVLSVFADVRLLLAYLQTGKRIFFNDVNYIYQKQLEEADVIVVNKIDLLDEEEIAPAKQLIEAEYAGKKIVYQNSLSEESIKRWLTVVMNYSAIKTLRPTLGIDYKIYGAGEAEMAWLDEEIGIVTTDATAVAAAYTLMNTLYDKITDKGYATGHLKFFMDDGEDQRKISFTTLGSNMNTDTGYSKANRVVLLINARVQAPPELLQQIVQAAVIETEQVAGCKITENNISCFKPGYPQPVHRVAG